jgi:hypothetical protein
LHANVEKRGRLGRFILRRGGEGPKNSKFALNHIKDNDLRAFGPLGVTNVTNLGRISVILVIILVLFGEIS